MTGLSIARVALLCNAGFSALCGLAFALDAERLATELLAGSPDVGALGLRVLGVGLVVFSALLAWVALRRGLTAGQILLITSLDVAWIAGSLLVIGLAAGVFTAAGVTAVALVALAVTLFATGQGFGAARMA